MLIWWGPDLIKLYNDAYRPMLLNKHPRALGQRGRECWPEIWDIIGPMLDGVLTRGEATWSENQLLPLERNGYAEECYFTFSYSPIRDESGGVGGVFTAVTETTQQVLGERRLGTLRALAANTAEARTPEEVCSVAAQTLADNPADLPFALLYLLTPDGTRARLAGTAGLPIGAPLSPPLVKLADNAAPWPLAQIVETEMPVLVDDLGYVFGSSALEETARPRAALVLPVIRAGQARPYGFLVAGISPRRLLDDDYRGFLTLVAGQVATACTSARAYQDAQERAQALAELDRAKTAFFSNVSHEFRTPLTLSLGPLEAVLADPAHPLSAEQRTQLEMVRRNELRQLKLVNTLLDFSRIEAGRMEAAYAPTDLAHLTADLASAFRSAIAQAGLQLIVECPPLPEPIYVDRDMWEKIVLNLLSNALKFTFEGSIRVALQLVDEAIELVVQDTGIGVREEELPHLFERFYRVHHMQARTQEGSGIGLSLVQELVRLHGGTIAVQSTEDVGTTFTVRLPRGYAHLPAEHRGSTHSLSSTALGADPYVEEALRWLPELPPAREDKHLTVPDRHKPSLTFTAPAPLSSPDAAATGQPRRLLVVDDNADMRDYLKRLLASSYQVHVCADGNSALTWARTGRPDLVISDVMLPGLDGFALLKALRADPETSPIPVILLSARAGEEATLEGLNAGADDYLVKPFSARELLVRVEARLEIAHLRREAEVARQHLYDLFMQAPAFICVLRGPEHVFELANLHYLQFVGNRELIGKSAREALPELEGQGFFELLDRVYESGEPFIGNEIPALIDRHLDGTQEEGFFNFVYQPSRNMQGEVDGILAHVVEVTEQVQARRLIQEREQRKDAFLDMTSHELRTPITAIKGNLQLAERRLARLLQQSEELSSETSKTVEDVSAMIARALRQTGVQVRLINDLLDVSRLQANKLDLSLSRCDLVGIVRETVADQRATAPKRTIVFEQEEAAPVFVMADADRIEQVVSNYLTNALKYSPSTEPVVVGLSVSSRTVRVWVRDRGPGLSLEQQQQVWERFYQATEIKARSGSKQGLGLGLYICQTLIRRHEGQVGVESQPGSGSTFWFSLPLA